MERPKNVYKFTDFMLVKVGVYMSLLYKENLIFKVSHFCVPKTAE